MTNHEDIRVTHRMANGEVRSSVRGYLQSPDQLPETAQRLISEMIVSGSVKNCANTENEM